MSSLSDKVNEVYDLLERIWLYIPSAGTGESPWSTNEKNQFLSRLFELEKLKKKVSKKITDEKKQTDELEEDLFNLTQDFQNFKNFSDLVISYLAESIDLEDLERIEGKIQKYIKSGNQKKVA